MKNSGIEWIGEIPKDWEVRKIKTRFAIQAGFTPDTKNDSYYNENGYDWVNISDLVDGKTINITNTKKKISKVYLDKFPHSIVKQGSLLYSFKLSVGQTAFAGKDLYTNEAIVSILPTQDDNLKFLNYATFLIIFNAQTNIYGANILNQDLIKNAIIAFPSIAGQQKIADFLDEKCAKIDNLISHEEATIEELKAYKQSVITEAVTKGFDRSVPMKDSGADWIGDIPAHWIADRLKNILAERNEKNDPIKTTERLSLSIDLGITLYADKTTNLDRFKDDFTQYKIAYPNDLVLNSMNMIVGAVGVSSFYGCVSPAYYVLYSKAKKDYMSKFFYYLFKTKSMNRYLYSIGRGIYAIERGDDRVNTCRLKISRDDLNNLLLPIPPDDEMLRIIKKVEETELAVDNLIRAKQQKIEELKEYKKSLIYEYVTGKKEVT